MTATFGRSLLLLLTSVLLFGTALVAGYETYEHFAYERWRVRFDNQGALERLTVASDNPVLLWEYRPYGHYRNIRTNRYGFRDIDRDLTPKPPGVFRVIFVGDSVTLGLGVDLQDTFVRRFDREIARIHPRIETLNLGIDGYNVQQIGELVRTRALDFEPDAVVYVMALNDFDYEDASAKKILYFREPRSFLLARLRRLARIWSNEEYHAYHFRRNGADGLHQVEAMQDELSARGIEFFTILVPIFDESLVDFEDYPLEPIHRQIGRRLREAGVPFLDLLDDFRRQGLPPHRFADDIWHPNEAGHRFIAGAMLERLAGVDVPGQPVVVAGRR